MAYQISNSGLVWFIYGQVQRTTVIAHVRLSVDDVKSLIWSCPGRAQSQTLNPITKLATDQRNLTLITSSTSISLRGS